MATSTTLGAPIAKAKHVVTKDQRTTWTQEFGL